MTGQTISPLDQGLVSTVATHLELAWMRQEAANSGTLDPFRNCTAERRKVLDEIPDLVKKFRVHHARSLAVVIAAIYDKVVGIEGEKERQDALSDAVHDYVSVLSRVHLRESLPFTDMALEVGHGSNKNPT